MNADSKRIWETIEASKRCAIVSHTKPDGDTLGAGLAFFHLFKTEDREIALYSADPPPELFSYLPGVELYKDELDCVTGCDCIIVLDAGDKAFAGLEHLPVSDAHQIINIDHHASNTRFGDLNFVDGDASSTCEIAYRMFLERGEEITPTIANCLLTGLVTDTAGFYNAATSPEVLNAASSLVRKGASLQTIIRQTLTLRTLSALRVWGIALERLKTDPKTDIVTTFLSHEDLVKCGARLEDLKELPGFIASVKPSKAVFMYVQHEDGNVKASLRTTRDDVDLAQVAQTYGGGGHKKAAGFLVSANVIESQSRWELIPKLI